MQRLSSAFRMRVLLELVRLKKKRFPEHIFLTRARSAILNIFDCLSNKHGKCKKHSLACCAHMDFYSPKFLPYGKHLDCNKIKTQITKISLKTTWKKLLLLKPQTCLRVCIIGYSPTHLNQPFGVEISLDYVIQLHILHHLEQENQLYFWSNILEYLSLHMVHFLKQCVDKTQDSNIIK